MRGKPIKRVVIVFLAIVVLFIAYSKKPTFGRQIRFNEWAWKHYPFTRIKYYMSDSLVKKLNIEKPTIEQTAEMLGYEDMVGNRIMLGDEHITYFLMTPTFYVFGLGMYTLNIDFRKDGSFESAVVSFDD